MERCIDGDRERWRERESERDGERERERVRERWRVTDGEMYRWR